MNDGHQALVDFARAPSTVQADFWAAIRKRNDWEVRVARFRESVADPEAPVPITLRKSQPRPVRWTRRWAARAARQREAERFGERWEAVATVDVERLKAIPAEDYVEKLTGEEIGRNRKINCPLPDHDERTPSFHVRDLGWKCYGCQESGTIYDLGAALWDLDPKGSGFVAIHRRLMEVFR
jgi:hypothetical protein